MCEDLLYVVNNYEEDVTLYFKHIIWNCQQDKAKTDTLENSGDKDIFWIKDWLQKILPRRFREPQQDYFGRNGMSQHVDVIYMKNDNNLHKCLIYPSAKMWTKLGTNIVSNRQCLQTNQSRFS